MTNKFNEAFMAYMEENFEEAEKTENKSVQELLSIAKNAAEEHNDNEMAQDIDQCQNYLDNYLEEGKTSELIFYTILAGVVAGMLIGKGINYYLVKEGLLQNKPAIEQKAEEIKSVPKDEFNNCVKKTASEFAEAVCRWASTSAPKQVVKQTFNR